MNTIVSNKYNEVSKSYSSEYNNLYWQISDELTINFMDKYIPGLASIIDIGCGTGNFGIYYLLNGRNVDFCDISEKMLDIVRKKVKSINYMDSIDFINKDIKSNSFSLSKSYDVMIMEGDVLGYCLQEDKRALANLDKYLNNEGIIFIGVDNIIKKSIKYFKNDIEQLNKLLESNIDTCPYGLPIKQYSYKILKDILPFNWQIEDYISKPIFTQMLSKNDCERIKSNYNLYRKLLKIEQKFLDLGYLDLGSHYTFLIKKINN